MTCETKWSFSVLLQQMWNKNNCSVRAEYDWCGSRIKHDKKEFKKHQRGAHFSFKGNKDDKKRGGRGCNLHHFRLKQSLESLKLFLEQRIQQKKTVDKI